MKLKKIAEMIMWSMNSIYKKTKTFKMKMTKEIVIQINETPKRIEKL